MANFLEDHFSTIASMFGTLIACIVGLAWARIANVSNRMGKEFDAVWKKIDADNNKCNQVHAGISTDVGYIKAKLEDISIMLPKYQEEMYAKIDRVTTFLRSERDDIKADIRELQRDVKERGGK